MQKSINRMELQRLLHAYQGGDQDAKEVLFRHLYPKLRRLIHRKYQRDLYSTKQPTEILHDALIKLNIKEGSFENYEVFEAFAVKVVRGCLIDYLRSRRTQKRGCHVEKVSIDEALHGEVAPKHERVFAMQEALKQLAQENQKARRIMDLRLVDNQSIKRTAEILDLSEHQVRKLYDHYKIWLAERLGMGGIKRGNTPNQVND